MSINIEIVPHYWALAVFIIMSIILCCTMLFGSWFLGGQSFGRYKNTPFESGIASVGSAKLRFPVKFYLISMFFVIFDIEALYLYAWSVAIRESGWSGFLEVTVFICCLLSGLLYLIRIGALNWSPRNRSFNIKK